MYSKYELHLQTKYLPGTLCNISGHFRTADSCAPPAKHVTLHTKMMFYPFNNIGYLSYRTFDEYLSLYSVILK